MSLSNLRLLQLIALCLCINFGSFDAKKLCIIIPAYNEEKRIEHTIQAYEQYFQLKPDNTTFLVVANNCKDKTVEIVQNMQKDYTNLELIDLKPGGKGFAVKQGFLWAKDKDFDLIGFVDADMATLPQYFYDLVVACNGADGAIASRYATGATVFPSRPWLKKLGGKFYNWMLRKKLNLSYKDTQCGAKIFTKDTVQKATPYMTEIGWSWDLEFLYLCKLEQKVIKEIPTTWSDQPGSHLSISSKLIREFVNSPTRIKKRHATHKKELIRQRMLAKKQLKPKKKKK